MDNYCNAVWHLRSAATWMGDYKNPPAVSSRQVASKERAKRVMWMDEHQNPHIVIPGPIRETAPRVIPDLIRNPETK